MSMQYTRGVLISGCSHLRVRSTVVRTGLFKIIMLTQINLHSTFHFKSEKFNCKLVVFHSKVTVLTFAVLTGSLQLVFSI